MEGVMSVSNLKYKIILLFLIGFGFQTNASITLEPYAGGYAVKSSSSLNVTTTSPSATTTTDSSNSYSGAVYGAKLGYSLGPITIGGDFMMSSHGSESVTNIGPAATLDLGLIAFKATYFASSSMKSGATSASGSGLKAGVGFSLLPFIVLNFEYLNFTYTKMTNGDLPSTTTINSYDQKVSGGMISLSLVL